MKMYIVARSTVEEHQCTIPLDEPPFSWVVSWTLKCPITQPLTLSLFADNNYHWCDFSIDTLKLDRTGHVCTHKQSNVTMEYAARKRYCRVYGGLLLQVEVSRVSVEIGHYQLFRECLEEKDTHRIVALCKNVYLSRPQYIVDNSNTRMYVWKSDRRRRSFGSIPLHQEGDWKHRLQDGLDLEQIRATISPRLIDGMEEVQAPDRDGFVNERRLLPLTLDRDEDFCVEFHNLKYAPTRRVDLLVKRDRFSGRGRLESLQMINTRMTLSIEFKERVDRRVQITALELVVPNYLVELCNMELIEMLETV